MNVQSYKIKHNIWKQILEEERILQTKFCPWLRLRADFFLFDMN